MRACCSDAPADAGAGDGGDADGASAPDDVVDAEFEEVDKDDKS